MGNTTDKIAGAANQAAGKVKEGVGKATGSKELATGNTQHALSGAGEMKPGMWTWMRVQFFRFWTALVVLGAYGYFWLNMPEYLTWWKRTVNTLTEKGCDMLSYPWGDRIESTVGNFGIWVQITLAILVFRAIIGIVLILTRTTRRRKQTLVGGGAKRP